MNRFDPTVSARVRVNHSNAEYMMTSVCVLVKGNFSIFDFRFLFPVFPIRGFFRAGVRGMWGPFSFGGVACGICQW